MAASRQARAGIPISVKLIVATSIVVAVAANAYVTGETVQVNGGLYFS